MIELAAVAPERVARAVLLDPAVWVPPPVALERAEEYREVQSFAAVAEAVEWRRRLSPLAPVELIEEEMDAHLAAGENGLLRMRYAPSAVISAFGEMAKVPPLSGLASTPTLIVRAPDGEVCPDPIIELCRESIPGVEVVDVDGGHIVMWDALDDTARAVERFLA